MKFVALVSGGKDSIYSIIESVRNGHELVACVHLEAPLRQATDEESFMYQSAASEVIPVLVEECLGVPLLLHRRTGVSANTSLVYQSNISENDEVEDMFLALRDTKSRFPEIQAVSSGAILSTYQRVRIEHVCSRLGLASLSYLWRMATQHELLKRMLEDGISAILVKTACPPGLVPRKHLNQTLDNLYYSGIFEKLNDRYQFHMCGEGGEYESLVLDCPLYKKRLVIDDFDIKEEEDVGVGELVVKRCHTTTKHAEPIPERKLERNEPGVSVVAPSTEANQAALGGMPLVTLLPHVRQVSGGLLHVSEMISPAPLISQEGDTEGSLAVQEALSIFRVLRRTLGQHGATPQDVLLVHLYLSEISHFAGINAHYREFFGTLLPPSRSCVAIGRGVFPGGRRVLLDCIVQVASGSYMRSMYDKSALAKVAALTTTSSLRQVLHVQSISYWAPVCVGPYSQVNTLRSGIHFLAGQIGLVPQTMLLRNTWTGQLEQCWTNVARVLDALDKGSLDHMISCLVYVSSKVISQPEEWNQIEAISRRQILTNCGVAPGAVDDGGAAPANKFDGYEDEETWQEHLEQSSDNSSALTAMLFVCVPEMPMGALAETEVICASRRAVDGLSLVSTSTTSQIQSKNYSDVSHSTWTSALDFAEKRDMDGNGLVITASTRALGNGCVAASTISASLPIEDVAQGMYAEAGLVVAPEDVLYDMLSTQRDIKSTSGLAFADILHIRLYYRTSGNGLAMRLDDGIRLRSALSSALASLLQKSTCSSIASSEVPACSAIPVRDMRVVHSQENQTTVELTTILAMQVLFLDPIHLETEMWINCDR